MTDVLRCISPIDDSIFAERQALGPREAAQAVEIARMARKDWGSRPIEERINLVLGGVERIGATNAEVVPELAWQMGRPTKYGGEFGGFKERAD